MAESKQIDWKKILARLVVFGKYVVVLMSKSTTGMAVIAAAVLVAGVLSYFYAFLPLQQEVGLPEGVLDEQPNLQTSILQEIADQQVERSNYTTRLFSGLSPHFRQVVPTPVPIESPTSPAEEGS